MIKRIPFKISLNSQIDFQAASGHRLRIGIYLDSGHVMDELVEDLAQHREFGQFGDLLWAHLVERLPAELLFFLHFTEHVFGDLTKLSQRVHAAPHTLIDHLSQL